LAVFSDPFGAEIDISTTAGCCVVVVLESEEELWRSVPWMNVSLESATRA
jgi:hypothetical protein